MISKLTGTISHTETKYIILEVNGVGYKISINSETASKIIKSYKNITFWTYLAVRENALDLYGFLTIEELNFFELLITISGIGPKTAQGIMNAASIQTLGMAIQTGDSTHLTKINGIGKKVAEKIIMELKDKIETIVESTESKESIRNNSDTVEALISLGYSQIEARNALKEIPKNLQKTSDKIKEALKILNR